MICLPGLKTKDTEAGSVPEIEKKYTLATPRRTSQAVTTEKTKPAQNVRSEMEILRTKEDADKFVQEDPYVLNGIVTSHEVREWSVVV